LACIEASYISALRTAVSAILAAEQLHKSKKNRTLAIVGTGYISKNIANCAYNSITREPAQFIHSNAR
jgi:ornithine cyclodeaminase/alanine dehydrogenase-like protein (mu-crystallin family)